MAPAQHTHISTIFTRAPYGGRYRNPHRAMSGPASQRTQTRQPAATVCGACARNGRRCDCKTAQRLPSDSIQNVKHHQKRTHDTEATPQRRPWRPAAPYSVIRTAATNSDTATPQAARVGT